MFRLYTTSLQNKYALNAWGAWARWRNNERETAWEKCVKVPIDMRLQKFKGDWLLAVTSEVCTRCAWHYNDTYAYLLSLVI